MSTLIDDPDERLVRDFEREPSLADRFLPESQSAHAESFGAAWQCVTCHGLNACSCTHDHTPTCALCDGSHHYTACPSWRICQSCTADTDDYEPARRDLAWADCERLCEACHQSRVRDRRVG
jgi:hypothetical protein